MRFKTPQFLIFFLTFEPSHCHACREILEGYTNWSEKCATECPKLILGREHPLQFRFILNTDNVLVGQYVIPNRETGFPTIKDAYTSLVRFDWKFCGDEVLRGIETGEIGVTIGDGAYGMHEIDSMIYPRLTNVHKMKHGIFVQFSKLAHSEADTVSRNRKRDVIFISLHFNGEQRWESETFRQCLQKAHLSLIPEAQNDMDYSLCIAYEKYGLEPDWNQDTPTSTTEWFTSGLAERGLFNFFET